MDDQVLNLLLEMIKANKADMEKRFNEVALEQINQSQKLDELLSFKWKLAGVTAVVSVIGGVLMQIMLAKIGSM